MTCSHCGAPIETVYRRGPLTAAGNPVRIYLGGTLMKLPGFQAQALALLIRHGRVSHERLATLSRTRSANSVKGNLARLRQELPPGISVYSDRGWGYVLDIGDTPRQLPKSVRARLGG